MANRKKLTQPQSELLKMINSKKDTTGIFEYYEMKKLCSEFKSYDGSFNALLSNGHLKRFLSDKNTFITTFNN